MSVAACGAVVLGKLKPDQWGRQMLDAKSSKPPPVITLDDALKELGEQEPHLVQLVELRFFAGRTMTEISEILDRSQRSLERDWEFVRRWLDRKLRNSFDDSTS